MASKRGYAIGIDLGTTYSCAAVFEGGSVNIIKNELGQVTTPSHVAFADKTDTSATASPITVGDAAKYTSNVNPENSIYDVKRLIGRRFNDPVTQKDIKSWPFKVVDEDNSPRIHVNGKSYHPEQISAMLLRYIKDQAEKYLGGPVTDAVITVPAYFNDGQRQATKDAGSIAGLNVLRIINEPTAAAIAYNHQLQQQTKGKDGLKKKNVLIFDLGGGTFDLSLLTMEGSNIEVLAVDGDTHLGGQDFDNALVDYCIQEFKKKHNIDLSQLQPNAKNPAKEKFDVGKRLRRLKNNCEMKKVNLSAAKVVTLSIEVIYESLDLNVKIKRETFESINKAQFEKCIEIVERILTEAKMSKDEIDDVVLVGGSSRIPKVQEMIRNYFGGRAPCQNIKQDEAVAYGAAVQASTMVSKDSPSHVDSAVAFKDVIPHSIGIQIKVEEGVKENFSVILEKNRSVPCEETKQYFTSQDKQKSVRIGVYEGQSKSVAENHLLGEFYLENLPPNSKKGEALDVHMKINDEGILTVSAECLANKAKNDISVKALKGRLTQEELLNLRMQEICIATSTSEWGTVSSF